MYLKNCWYVAAWDHEITPGVLFSRKLLGQSVVMYRTAAGAIVAMADRCCHRLAPLSKGRLEGDCLRCMYHGLLFNPQGQCVDVPQQDRIPPNLNVPTYPVVERDKYVWIWLGDPSRADSSVITDAHWQDDPAWRCLPSYIHYPGTNYRYVVDNLLDFSHLGFVHENTLGGGRSSATVRPKVERFGWGVRITRWQLNDELPPFLKKVAKFSGPVDRWQIYDWRVAGNILSMDSGNAPAGTGAPEGHVVPEAVVFHSVQALTPEADRSTHYFWTFAHNFELDNPAVTQELANQIKVAFDEDRAIIEAQQRALDEYPEVQMRAISADAALNQARWLLDRLIADEQAPPASVVPITAAPAKA